MSGTAPDWTDAEKAAFRGLWADPKLETEEIARRLNRSVDAVKAKAVRMKLGKRPPARSYHGAQERRRVARGMGAA